MKYVHKNIKNLTAKIQKTCEPPNAKFDRINSTMTTTFNTLNTRQPNLSFPDDDAKSFTTNTSSKIKDIYQQRQNEFNQKMSDLIGNKYQNSNLSSIQNNLQHQQHHQQTQQQHRTSHLDRPQSTQKYSLTSTQNYEPINLFEFKNEVKLRSHDHNKERPERVSQSMYQSYTSGNSHHNNFMNYSQRIRPKSSDYSLLASKLYGGLDFKVVL